MPFFDKSKYVKQSLAANFETLAGNIIHYEDIFRKNIYATKDKTYNHLKRIMKDLDLVVVSCDKESCVVIINKID